MNAGTCRELLAAQIERILGQYTPAPTKADVDHLLVWADIYATAHTADQMVPVGQS